MKLQTIILALFLSACGNEYASCGNVNHGQSFDGKCKEASVECKNRLGWTSGVWYQSAYGIKTYTINGTQTPVLTIGYSTSNGINVLNCAQYPIIGIVECKTQETFYLERDWVPF